MVGRKGLMENIVAYFLLSRRFLWGLRNTVKVIGAPFKSGTVLLLLLLLFANLWERYGTNNEPFQAMRD
jgi:hypothetical protein